MPTKKGRGLRGMQRHGPRGRFVSALAAAAGPAGAARKSRVGRSKKKKLNNNALAELTTRKFTWLPWKMNCILPMTQLLVLTTDAAISVFGTDTQYSLNSIFRPRINPAGSAGLTVNGYTSLISHYRRYQVYGCMVELEFFDPGVDGMVVGWSIQPSDGNQTFAGNFIDASDARQGFATASMANTGSQKLVKKFYIPIGKAQGIAKLNFKVDQTNYAAAVTASPTLQPYLSLSAASATTAGAQTVRCLVRLNYYTRLYDKRTDVMTGYVVA